MGRNNFYFGNLHTPGQLYRPRIGIDVDGLIRNIEENTEKFLLKKYPKAKIIDPTQWEYFKRYSGIPKDIEYDIFKENPELIFGKSPPYQGAVKFISDLKIIAKKYGAHTAIVTKQTIHNGMETLLWLYNNKISTDAIFFIRDGESKILAECNILIDDNVKNLEEQEQAYGGAICIKRPWNKSWGKKRFSEYKDILREVEKKLMEIKKEKNEDLRKIEKNRKGDELFFC